MAEHLPREGKLEDLLRRVHLKVFDLRPETGEAMAWCSTCRTVNAKHGEDLQVGDQREELDLRLTLQKSSLR